MTPLMAVLPKVNAQVTKIAGAGFSEDLDYEGGTDTERWAGEEDAYLVEELQTDVQAGRRDLVSLARLIVPLDPGQLVVRGDTVTYRFGGELLERQVQSVEAHPVAGQVRLFFWVE